MKKSLILAFAPLFLFIFTPLTQANVPSDFGLEYGLILNTDPKETSLTRAEALKILTQIFPNYDWPVDLDMASSESICEIDFLNCEIFLSEDPMDQKTFVIWWSYLETPKLKFEDMDERYRKTWSHLRQNAWLPTGAEFNGSVLQTLLYRYQASQQYAGLPYLEGMVLELNEISEQNYPHLNQVNEVLDSLERLIAQVQPTAHLSQENTQLLNDLVANQQAFLTLKEALYQAKHPFNLIPSLPEDIKAKISENKINEVLSQVTYNYSKDIRGRRHNVITGLMEISGRVYQPEEEINYFNVLKANGLGDYAMAHNLVGGRSVEGYGGGLCGATTILFQTLLNSGLFHPGEKGNVRYNHSALYQSLYPPGSLGKDAVTYFYSKTVILKNHFTSPVLFYTYDNPEKKEITLYLLGNSPYEYVKVSDAEKTGKNRYRVTQALKSYGGEEEVRYLNSYYSGGLR